MTSASTGGSAAGGSFSFSPRPNQAAAINWHEWGEEPFRLALKQQKPVLLAISAVWCHWCHVLDETGFSDSEVISLINRSFIPVRVDSDRRPDINARYNNGGWPTIALLTPDAEVVAGSTYMPPDDLSRFLVEVSRMYEKNALEITAAIEQVRAQQAESEGTAAGELNHGIAANVLKVAGDLYDHEHGGFGGQAKFLHPGVLSLILASLAGSEDEELKKMLTGTLDAMSGGGIHDAVEDGFFRYAMKPDWSEPHYEKMLEDNAAMLAIYADAFLLTGEERYAETARGLRRFLETVLLDPESGAFGGSQDADGEYYRLAAPDRSASVAPAVDRTVYAGANAQAAAALFRAYQVLGGDASRKQALGALDFVWDRMWDEKQGPYHYLPAGGGMPQLPGLLADAAPLLGACLDAYESGGGEAWLDRAIATATWMLENLWDSGAGAFFDAVTPPGKHGLAAERLRPPAENVVAAAGLIRLAQTTGQPRFGDAAREALTFFAGTYRELGLFAAGYALAVARLLEPPVRVTIAGPPAAAPAAAMIRAAHRARVPFRSVEILDPAIHGEELKVTGYGYEGKPVAYICIGASCQPPVFAAGDLPGRIESGRAAVLASSKK